MVFNEELAELYWTTDIPIKELLETYGNGETSPKKLLKLMKPFIFRGITCPDCGKNTEANSRQNRTDIFRSLASKGLDLRKTTSTTYRCNECYKSYQDKRWQEQDRLLDGLRQRRLELHYMAYKLYLQTDEWKTTRRKILRIASYACQVCNTKERLSVHHRTYERRGFENIKDLIVLCSACHEVFHKNGKLTKKENTSSSIQVSQEIKNWVWNRGGIY